jgi:DNA (cytosine-5)-methyltransferase 1
LFAGIGGFDLGFERAGMVCKWQVEIDPFCQAVLAKHWPDVRRWTDIRTLFTTSPQRAADWKVDVICGGFPCQDISNAGERNGIDSERSGLWRDYVRIVDVVRPRFVVVENVAALLVRGMGRVLGDLAALGYDAEWDCLPAAAFGARHLRDRVFIIASSGAMDNGNSVNARCFSGQPEAVRRWRENTGIRCSVGWGPWAAESGVGRTAHGIPKRVDRKRGVGNAVVPAIAEWLGRRVIIAACRTPALCRDAARQDAGDWSH